MSEELQNPPVVDLDLIFQAIPGENPAGESLRYSGIYDEMREARRADENLATLERLLDAPPLAVIPTLSTPDIGIVARLLANTTLAWLG